MSITDRLYRAAIYQREGLQSRQGALCVKSGKYTARYASAKYIVDEEGIDVIFNQYHQPMELRQFLSYWDKTTPELNNCSIHGNYQVGNHPLHNIHVHVATQTHWHQLFAQHLFLTQKNQPMANWSLRCLPEVKLSDEHPVFIGICLSEKKVLICGTGYAGEIKKAMFTVMNILLPEQNVLSMHCSAVLSPQKKTTLLLGLSGTGKTTLSSTPGLQIIGDDEHGWGEDGIFNLEGGCYAKTINLSSETEPQIHHALKPPAILENIILDANNNPDFSDATITENLRAAYSLSHIPNHHAGIAPHPSDIIFLCCDLYGVIPAVSLLTPQQALEYFVIGYTARIGATEVNQPTVRPVSSPCFGHPFFARDLQVYQKLFSQRIHAHNSRVWLVNTGWGTGGLASGSRYPIAITREIIQAIIHQSLNQDSLSIHTRLGLRYFETIQSKKIDLSIPGSWEQSLPFQTGCDKLTALFKQSLSEYCTTE
jgi:phosphoenolpyruvate carboxykinase (ATP)